MSIKTNPLSKVKYGGSREKRATSDEQ